MAALLVVVAALLWSIAGVITRGMQSAGSFEMSFWRSLFAALTVATYLAATQGTAFLARVLCGGRMLWISGLMWAVMFTCFMVAMTLTRVANVLIVQSLTPVLTALLAGLVLRRPVGLRDWGVILVAAAGIASMYVFDIAGLGARHLLGVMIAFGIPVAASINWVLSQRVGSGLDLTGAVLLGGLVSVVVTLPLAWPLHGSLPDVALLAMLGVVQLGLPCILVVRAARGLPAHEVALLTLLEVVFGILLAWAWGGERPGLATLIGGALVLGALAYHERSRTLPLASAPIVA
jgi:drug/metabolite transporter (DMT)-like permease